MTNNPESVTREPDSAGNSSRSRIVAEAACDGKHSFDIRASSFICHSSFVIRHSIGLLALAGTLCLSGCKQVMLLGLILGGPPSIEPDFDAETGKALDLPDVTVAVICYAPTEIKFANPNIDHELSRVVAHQLVLNDIAVVRPDVVNAWLDANPDWDHAEEVGAAMEVNYVIEIELESFSLYEENSAALFRGRTVTLVNVYEMDESGHGERIFAKEIELVFPTEVPRPTYDMSQTEFKLDFLSRLSDRIGWLFYERYSGAMIPWAT